jgi:hypothetical protein
MAPDQSDPSAWSNESFRAQIIHLIVRINALESLLVAKGILGEGQLDQVASQENIGEVLAQVDAWIANRRFGSES